MANKRNFKKVVTVKSGRRSEDLSDEERADKIAYLTKVAKEVKVHSGSISTDPGKRGKKVEGGNDYWLGKVLGHHYR